MTEEQANLMLEHMRQFRNQLADLVGEVRVNQHSIDGQLGMIRHQLSTMAGYQVLQDEGISHMRQRIERIERRLDLVDDKL